MYEDEDHKIANSNSDPNRYSYPRRETTVSWAHFCERAVTGYRKSEAPCTKKSSAAFNDSYGTIDSD
jgi:hypothetical protein